MTLIQASVISHWDNRSSLLPGLLASALLLLWSAINPATRGSFKTDNSGDSTQNFPVASHLTQVKVKVLSGPCKVLDDVSSLLILWFHSLLFSPLLALFPVHQPCCSLNMSSCSGSRMGLLQSLCRFVASARNSLPSVSHNPLPPQIFTHMSFFSTTPYLATPFKVVTFLTPFTA